MDKATVQTAVCLPMKQYDLKLWGGMPPSAGELAKFLDQPQVRMFAKHPKYGVCGTWFWDCDSVESLNNDGWNIYVVLNETRLSFCGVKPSDKDILLHRWVLLDFDLLEGAEFVSATHEILHVNGGSFFTFDQWTGRGLQRWIRYKPTADIKLAVAQTRWIVQEAKTKYDLLYSKIDTCTTDASRLARWPNTIHWGTGFRGCVVNNRVFEFPRTGLGVIEVPEAPTISLNTGLTNLSDIAPRLNGISSRFLLEGVEHNFESRHKAANATARCLKEIGLNEERATELVLGGAAICTRAGQPFPLSKEEAEHCVRTAYHSGT